MSLGPASGHYSSQSLVMRPLLAPPGALAPPLAPLLTVPAVCVWWGAQGDISAA